MAVTTSGPSDKPISGKKGVGGRGMQSYSPNYQAERKAAKQRPAGMTGSADAMERKLKASKKGRPSFGKNQGVISSNEAPYDRDADLRAMLGGGGGGGSRRAYSDEQVAAASAKLQAIYNRYAQDIAAREADIAANYEKSGANLGSIYDTSVGNINKAYDAARAEQTRQLLALGMTEQTPMQSFGNQTQSIEGLQRLRAAVLAQNEATKNAAITNQRLASEAAQREGAQTAAQAAAQMASEMVSTGGGGGGGLSPYQYASLVLQRDKLDSANQQAAAKLAAQGQKTVPNMQAALDFAAKSNLTPDQIRAAQFYLSNQ